MVLLKVKVASASDNTIAQSYLNPRTWPKWNWVKFRCLVANPLIPPLNQSKNIASVVLIAVMSEKYWVYSHLSTYNCHEVVATSVGVDK